MKDVNILFKKHLNFSIFSPSANTLIISNFVDDLLNNLEGMDLIAVQRIAKVMFTLCSTSPERFDNY